VRVRVPSLLSLSLLGFPVVRAGRGPSPLILPTCDGRSSLRWGFLQGFCGQSGGRTGLPLPDGGDRVDPAVPAVAVGVDGAERGRAVRREPRPAVGCGQRYRPVGAGDA